MVATTYMIVSKVDLKREYAYHYINCTSSYIDIRLVLFDDTVPTSIFLSKKP
jgi:hypothetical protein